MFISLLAIAFLLFSLFILSRKISTAIYLLTYVLTRSKTAALVVLTTILLPGTIIHELSHFFIALILFVPTGDLSVFPTVEKDGTIRAGRLMIGKVDPFRHTIVGLAPIGLGLSAIYFLGKLFLSTFSGASISLYFFLLFSVLCYLFFVISLTMFSSKKDVESVLIAGPIIVLVVAALYRTGLRISFSESLAQRTEQILHILALSLLFSVVINLLIYGGLFLFQNVGKKLLRLKIA